MSSIHPPRIKYSGKLHLPDNTMNLHWVTQDVLITTEVWNNVTKPWKWNMNTVITADNGYLWVRKWVKGNNYHVTKTFDNEGMLIGIYVDICSSIKKEHDVFSFTDWYLDVWQEKGKEPILLDEDEFEDAIKAHYLTEDEIRLTKETASFITKSLQDGSLIDF